MQNERPWGFYEVIETSDLFQIKKIFVNPDKRLSLQSHLYRAEHWYILSGSGQVTVDDTTLFVNSGDAVAVPIGAKHRIGAVGEFPLIFIEIQTGSSFDEGDIVRYDDDFGRAEI